MFLVLIPCKLLVLDQVFIKPFSKYKTKLQCVWGGGGGFRLGWDPDWACGDEGGYLIINLSVGGQAHMGD